MHQIEVDRYVKFNEDVWRVECATCGIAADDLNRNDAAQVARVLARRMCGAIVTDGSRQQTSRADLHDLPLTDQQIVAMWRRRDDQMS